MANCPNCGAPIGEDAAFCTNCGTRVTPPEAPQASYVPPQDANIPPQGGNVPPQGPYTPPQYAYVPDPKDHTAEFDPEDIAKNKVIAMAAYLLGTLGIIIALLAAPESKYATFHSRQALKFSIVDILLSIIMVVLCWTLIVPIAGAICILILLVIRIICFFQVCSGKAKDAPIIGSLPFLK